MTENESIIKEEILNALAGLLSCGALPCVPLPYFFVKEENGVISSDVAIAAGEISEKSPALFAQLLEDEMYLEPYGFTVSVNDENILIFRK